MSRPGAGRNFRKPLQHQHPFVDLLKIFAWNGLAVCGRDVQEEEEQQQDDEWEEARIAWGVSLVASVQGHRAPLSSMAYRLHFFVGSL